MAKYMFCPVHRERLLKSPLEIDNPYSYQKETAPIFYCNLCKRRYIYLHDKSIDKCTAGENFLFTHKDLFVTDSPIFNFAPNCSYDVIFYCESVLEFEGSNYFQKLKIFTDQSRIIMSKRQLALSAEDYDRIGVTASNDINCHYRNCLRCICEQSGDAVNHAWLLCKSLICKAFNVDEESYRNDNSRLIERYINEPQLNSQLQELRKERNCYQHGKVMINLDSPRKIKCILENLVKYLNSKGSVIYSLDEKAMCINIQEKGKASATNEYPLLSKLSSKQCGEYDRQESNYCVQGDADINCSDQSDGNYSDSVNDSIDEHQHKKKVEVDIIIIDILVLIILLLLLACFL